MKNTVITLAILCSLGLGTAMAQEVGDNAPDFSLDILGGGTFTLSEQNDKLVLIFVFGYTCHLCEQSAPTVKEKLIDPYLEYEEFVPIGIDIWDGSASGVEEFRDATHLDIPLLMMGSGFASDYNTIQDRVIVVDQEGKIAYKNNGGAGSVTHQVIPVIEEKLGIENPTSVETIEADLFKLGVNPNPVSDYTSLNFELDRAETADITITGLDGRMISKVFYGMLQAGEQNISLDLTGAQSGIYFVSFVAGEKRQIVQILKN